MADETTPAPAEATAAPAAEAPVATTPAAAGGAPAAPAGTPAAAAPQERVSTSGDKQVSQNIWLEIGGEEAAAKIIKAKGSKNVSSGIVHVYATFNNTIVTITDRAGGSIGWSTAGKMGFRGSRKGTAYAAQVVAQDACRQAMGHGLREVEVRLRGAGSGRESAVRAVQALGVEMTCIKDTTPIPHNGCRPPKSRRV